jgi:hypothetical protein
MHDPMVTVRRHCTDANRAVYPLEAVRDLHWATSDANGYHAPPMLHAFVSGEHALNGTLDHQGLTEACPHQIEVCIGITDNSRAVMATLRSLAPPRVDATSTHPVVEDRKCASFAEVVPIAKADDSTRGRSAQDVVPERWMLRASVPR